MMLCVRPCDRSSRSRELFAPNGGGWWRFAASRWGATAMYKAALGNLALHSLESLELIHRNSCNCTKACMFVDCKREPGQGPTPPTET